MPDGVREALRGATATGPPLVGRAALLTSIAAAPDEQGRLLRGPTGVGTTRLLAEITAAATSAGRPSLVLVASESLASVPLGVFLSVVPTAPTEAAAAEVSTGQTAALAVRSLDAPPLVLAAAAIRAEIVDRGIRLLVVDDAHLLDAASAGLIHQLALSGVAVFAAVRHGALLPDAIAALGSTGLAPLEEVAPFSRSETHRLLELEFGGPVDRRLGSVIFDQTGGNALFIREVVRDAGSAGAVARRDGVWVLTGRMPLGPAARSLLAARVNGLPRRVRAAVELIALAGALDVGVLAGLVASLTMEKAEAAGVIEFDQRSRAVRIAPPLRAEAIVTALGARRRLELSRELADGITARIDATGIVTDEERVLLARLRLEIGDSLHPDDPLEIAGLLGGADPVLRDRLLQVALRADTSAATRLRIATMLAHQHRQRAAELLLATLDDEVLGRSERIAEITARALLLALPGNRPALALELVENGLETLGSSAELIALRATALARLGRVGSAVRAGLPLVVDPEVPAGAAAQAGISTCAALMSSGDEHAFAAVRGAILPLIDLIGGEIPEAVDAIAVADHHFDLLVRDDLDAARARGERSYNAALERSDDGVRSQHAILLGWNAVLRGDLETGRSYLAESLAARGVWRPTTLPWARALYAEALVLSGRQDEALAVLAEITASPRAPIYDVDIALAESSVLAASGDLAGAARCAMNAASRAQALGQRLPAEAGYYAATRYGDRDAAQHFLASSSSRSAADRARRAHAAAILRSDASGAESASAQFETQHLIWYAVEAQSHAVSLFRNGGASYRASNAATRLASLLEKCPALRSPVVAALPRTAKLTPREIEIAQFASSGFTDRAISESLGIALRTVQTHLARVYNKLGARSRGELRAWLPAQPSEETFRVNG